MSCENLLRRQFWTHEQAWYEHRRLSFGRYGRWRRWVLLTTAALETHSKLYTQPSEADFGIWKHLSMRLAARALLVAASFAGRCMVFIVQARWVTPRHFKEQPVLHRPKTWALLKAPNRFTLYSTVAALQNQIHETLDYGVIKNEYRHRHAMGFLEGILISIRRNEAYLQGQLVTPEGAETKQKFYDPRIVDLRKGQTILKRAGRSIQRFELHRQKRISGNI